DQIDDDIIVSLLIHEGVHIWQEVRKYVGEEAPSAEFEAYSIQSICTDLIASYREQVNQKQEAEAAQETKEKVSE
ncbi:hypothetical protein QN363_20475, partial [Undibacterium sp. CCC2.1]